MVRIKKGRRKRGASGEGGVEELLGELLEAFMAGGTPE